MQILEGKSVAEKIKKNIEEKIKNQIVKPNIAVLGINGDEASNVYTKRIKKNCEKYGIGFNLLLADTEKQFRDFLIKLKMMILLRE